MAILTPCCPAVSQPLGVRVSSEAPLPLAMRIVLWQRSDLLPALPRWHLTWVPISAWGRLGFQWAASSQCPGAAVAMVVGEHGVRSCPPLHPLHCPPGTWVGRALGDSKVAWALLGELLTLMAHCVPLRPAFQSRAVCTRAGPPLEPCLCLTVCTFISPLPAPPPSPSACLCPCVSPHTPPSTRGMAHPCPSRPSPPWHRMARCLAHHGPRITPARWVPRSSKPASSAWVMILATTPRYLPPAWSTLRGDLRREK